MKKKTKLTCIFSLIALFLFLCSSIAYCDVPKVTNSGKKVPARTAAKKKPAPAKKPSQQNKPAAVVPAPAVLQPGNEAICSGKEAIGTLADAIALIEQERYQKALHTLVCAVKNQPYNPDAWYWFGVWNNKTGNFSNAQKYFAKALEIDPNYPALSRLVVYPGDPHDKHPLWDPKRPTDIKDILPLKEMNVVAPGSPESLSEPRPEMENNGETPVYLPPNP